MRQFVHVVTVVSSWVRWCRWQLWWVQESDGAGGRCGECMNQLVHVAAVVSAWVSWCTCQLWWVHESDGAGGSCRECMSQMVHVAGVESTSASFCMWQLWRMRESDGEHGLPYYMAQCQQMTGYYASTLGCTRRPPKEATSAAINAATMCSLWIECVLSKKLETAVQFVLWIHKKIKYLFGGFLYSIMVIVETSRRFNCITT